MSTESARYLATAKRIADDIARSAIWHDDRCTWIGAMPEEAADGRTAMTHVGFGADLYGGTAGVGLFLAELHAAIGEPEIRRTAMGALRHAAARAGDVPRAVAFGLHAGRTGTALALARAGALLGVDELRARAADLVAADHGAEASTDEFDLIAGAAGGIVGSLVLAKTLGDRRWDDRARRLGDRLVASCEVDGAGTASWRTVGFPTAANLTGLSHGAAGAGVALLELAHATGDASYADVAHRAFAYERGVYDASLRNWPDFRGRSGTPSHASCATFWCHGAPGIALSRIRAHELSSDETLRAEAITALETCRAWVAAAVESESVNYSLCHGLAGNAEILRDGAELTGPDATTLVERVADVGIERYGDPGRPWPCGTHEGSTASLLLGLAGIGYFYLRLAVPTVPSILLVRGDGVPVTVRLRAPSFPWRTPRATDAP